MPTNVMLIRWQGGWHERPLSDGSDLENLLPRRIEGTLGLGAAQSTQEVDRIADKQLDLFKNSRVAISAEIAPRFDDKGRTPYIGFQVGDKVTVEDVEERVVGVTVSEDEEGAVSYQVDWRDLVFEGEEAFAQWLKKMANGTLGGQAKPANPVSQSTGGGGNACPPTLPLPSGSGTG